jgi:hypothetical protein
LIIPFDQIQVIRNWRVTTKAFFTHLQKLFHFVLDTLVQIAFVKQGSETFQTGSDSSRTDFQ